MKACRRNKCIEYKAKKNGCGSRYEQGQKRCYICDIFIYWDGAHCPCCGHHLRTHARHSRTRKKYMETVARIG